MEAIKEMNGIKFKNHWCGKLSENEVGQRVTVAGWVSTIRDLGGIIFVELRDRSGVIQIVSDPVKNPEVHKAFEKLRNEYVITASGVLSMRPEETFNLNLNTGKIEIPGFAGNPE